MQTQQQTPYATDVTRTLNAHVTVRHFNGEPIPDGMLSAVLNAGRRSPTSSNTQSYSIIVVRDGDTRHQLAALAGDQRHIETCDVFVAFCADTQRLARACRMHGTTLVRNLELSLVASVDAALVGMSVQLAAESFGLGAVMIGAMRNHPAQVAELLGLPEGVYVVYGMCLGWPDPERVPPQKPRLPEDLVIHQERYDTADVTEALRRYDAELAAHYHALGRNQDEAAWTGVIANRLGRSRRPHLKGELERLGMRFD